MRLGEVRPWLVGGIVVTVCGLAIVLIPNPFNFLGFYLIIPYVFLTILIPANTYIQFLVMGIELFLIGSALGWLYGRFNSRKIT